MKPEALRKRLRDKDYRDEIVAENLRLSVAAQVRANRESRDLTQVGLAAAAKMKQSQISRLENARGDSLPNLATLTRVAAAFDVAIIVRFVPFSELAHSIETLETQSLVSPAFSEDAALTTTRDLDAVQTTASKIAYRVLITCDSADSLSFVTRRPSLADTEIMEIEHYQTAVH
jgi:transcriptional regulator with XRE-family HTH domain